MPRHTLPRSYPHIPSIRRSSPKMKPLAILKHTTPDGEGTGADKHTTPDGEGTGADLAVMLLPGGLGVDVEHVLHLLCFRRVPGVPRVGRLGLPH